MLPTKKKKKNANNAIYSFPAHWPQKRPEKFIILFFPTAPTSNKNEPSIAFPYPIISRA